MRIGAHESIAGGVHLAFERALADEAESLQIFTKSGRQWSSKPLPEADVRSFRESHARTGLPVIAHASYLINLGAPPGEVRQKSLVALRDELDRCEQLGVPWLVLHPGANASEDEGTALIAEAVRGALEATEAYAVGICLEITAGQGTSLGHSFGQLARLLDAVARPERTGVCLDTCHLFAAGYDLSTAEGYEAAMDEMERLVGRKSVRALHLNDAKKGLNSRVDRHDHIGDGTLGMPLFSRVVNDERFVGLPAVLETPEGRWKEEIALLKGLRARISVPST
jgi:deoxyribonuclease-4